MSTSCTVVRRSVHLEGLHEGFVIITEGHHECFQLMTSPGVQTKQLEEVCVVGADESIAPTGATNETMQLDVLNYNCLFHAS